MTTFVRAFVSVLALGALPGLTLDVMAARSAGLKSVRPAAPHSRRASLDGRGPSISSIRLVRRPGRSRRTDSNRARPGPVQQRAMTTGRFSRRQLGGMFGVGAFVTQRSSAVANLIIGRAKLLGARWVREEFTATRLHHATQGGYDWGTYDRVIAQERASGMQVLGLLDYSNTWGLGDHGTMPHDRIQRLSADFAHYAYAVARHFLGKINYWQVWNEPDLLPFWHPLPNAADYAVLLNAAYRTIKRADPRARVVLAGTNTADFSFVRQVAALTRSFDVVSVHPYRTLPEPGLMAEINALRVFHRPIWFSEIGWPAGDGCEFCPDENSQARYLVRFYTIAAAAGIERVFWYDLRDDLHSVESPEAHFGLLRYDLSGKPSFAAYAFLSRLFAAATYTGSPLQSKNRCYAYLFRGPRGPIEVTWNAGDADQTARLRWAAGAAFMLDRNGFVAGRAVVSHGRVTVTLSAGGEPLYLVSNAGWKSWNSPSALLHPARVPKNPARRAHSIRRSVPASRAAWRIPIRRGSSRKPERGRERRLRHRHFPSATPVTTPVPSVATPSPAPTATPSPEP